MLDTSLIKQFLLHMESSLNLLPTLPIWRGISHIVHTQQANTAEERNE